MKAKRNTFIFSAFVLAVGGIIAKTIGAFYKVPLTHVLGSNGIGVYYLIFPLYSLLLVLCSSGVSIAVTKLVATERSMRNKDNEMKIFTSGLVISFAMSLFFAILILLYGEKFAGIQGNVNATIGYIAIAPAIICSAIISIVRAYFQGIENMLPTSLSTIFEQLVKMMFGLILSYRLLFLGIEYAVLGAILGVTVSEFLAMILLIINFVSYKKKYDYKFFVEENKITKKPIYVFYKKILKIKIVYKVIKKPKKRKKKMKFKACVDKHYLSRRQAFLKVLRYSLPATLSSLIIPVTSFIDSFLIINILISIGFSSTIATSLYGLSNGMVASLISLPVLLIASISTAMVPNLSGTSDKNSIKTMEIKCSFFIKLGWLLALPMFLYFMLYSPEIIKILFGGGLTNRGFLEYDFAYKLLMFGSVSIIYYAFIQTFTAILQSINKPGVPFAALFVSLIFRTTLTYVLVRVPAINVFGVSISNIVFLSIASMICLISIKRHINLQISVRRFLLLPVFSAMISVITAYFLKMLLKNFLPVIAYSIISGAVGVAIYLGLIFTTKVFSDYEKELFNIKLRTRKMKKRLKKVG